MEGDQGASHGSHSLAIQCPEINESIKVDVTGIHFITSKYYLFPVFLFGGNWRK